MKTRLKFKLSGLITLLFMGFLMGCQELSETDTNLDLDNKGKGTVVIKLTDAPFPSSLVAEANVTIDWIKLYRNTTDEMEEEGEEENDEEMENDSSVVLVELGEPLTFNLLELSNGVTATLAEVDVPAGTYHEIRMHVVDAGIILNDETEFDLKIPSGKSSGLKIKIAPALEMDGGGFAEVLLDFDVSRSFVMRGNINHLGKGKINGFIFKPVIRAVAHVQTTTGEISGTVIDSTDAPVEDALLTLIADGDTVTSALTKEEGIYAIIGVPAGDYTLTLSVEDHEEQVNVSVAAGAVTEQDFVIGTEGEEETGDITGTVTDTTGVVVENALLTLYAGEDSITSANTNEQGAYSLEDIATGDYSLICAMEGYVSQDSSLTVVADETIEQNFVLVPEEEEEEGQ